MKRKNLANSLVLIYISHVAGTILFIYNLKKMQSFVYPATFHCFSSSKKFDFR